MRLIDAEKYRDEYLDFSNNEFNPMKTLDMQKTINAIVIPEEATNGDMIKALFPEWKIGYIRKMSGRNRYDCHIDSIHCIRFDDAWWNSEYKK